MVSLLFVLIRLNTDYFSRIVVFLTFYNELSVYLSLSSETRLSFRRYESSVSTYKVVL